VFIKYILARTGIFQFSIEASLVNTGNLKTESQGSAQRNFKAKAKLE